MKHLLLILPFAFSLTAFAGSYEHAQTYFMKQPTESSLVDSVNKHKKPVHHQPACDKYPSACSDNCCSGCMSSTGSYDGSYQLVCTP